MSLPLLTDRLIVREFVAADLDEAAEVFADPRVLWWEPAPWSPAQTAEYLARVAAGYREDGMAEYAVVLKATGRVIGDCGPVLRTIEGVREPELGWDLRSDHWGQGYATEAASAVARYALTALALPRLVSLIEVSNERSQGVARRLGMRVERSLVWAGLPHDLWVMERDAT